MTARTQTIKKYMAVFADLEFKLRLNSGRICTNDFLRNHRIASGIFTELVKENLLVRLHPGIYFRTSKPITESAVKQLLDKRAEDYRKYYGVYAQPAREPFQPSLHLVPPTEPKPSETTDAKTVSFEQYQALLDRVSNVEQAMIRRSAVA